MKRLSHDLPLPEQRSHDLSLPEELSQDLSFPESFWELSRSARPSMMHISLSR